MGFVCHLFGRSVSVVLVSGFFWTNTTATQPMNGGLFVYMVSDVRKMANG